MEACMWSKQAGLSYQGFSHREREDWVCLGIKVVLRRPDKVYRALHTVYTVIYTTEGWCIRCLAQNKCFMPTFC